MGGETGEGLGGEAGTSGGVTIGKGMRGKERGKGWVG